MKIYLSALGWITDAPAGNRLRWHYPFDALENAGQYVGLPDVVVIERAPVDREDLFQMHDASINYPHSWWDRLGDVTLSGFLPLHEHRVGPAQAIAFTWRGLASRIRVHDLATDRDIADRVVNDGELVYVEGPLIDSVTIYAFFGKLEDLRMLDLFRDRALEWKRLAQIKVAPSFAVGLAGVANRYLISPTISPTEWQELADVARAAQSSTPAAVRGEPTAWGNFGLLLGLRWEFALLGGFAFFDGPHPRRSELDTIRGNLLSTPPDEMMAYRVRGVGGPKAASNIAVCPASLAMPLVPPGIPQYVNPVVRLRERKNPPALTSGPLSGAMRFFTPLVISDDQFEVRLEMRWQQNDPHAIGVEIEETVSASPTLGSVPRQHRFMNRSRRPDQPPLQGSVTRMFDVAFPDVTLQARARALDAWDRVSPFSGATPATPLILRHDPPAPPLASAIYDGGVVRIARALAVPDVPDWEPDTFVRRTAGRVFLYRQTSAPRVVNAAVGAPMPLAPELYRSEVLGVGGLTDFVGGSIAVGGFIETIIDVSGIDVHFRALNSGGGSVQLFGPGAARLTQDVRHPALWTKVADFSALSLPGELVFSDPLPPASTTVVESYTARLAYFGRLGPAGTVVRTLRQPQPVIVPPPFTVDILGIDFFHRTMIKLRFTSPLSGGCYSVWWASGIVAPADLPQRGAAGLYGAQESLDGFTLFDVIALPIPQHVNRTVTIGVQRVVNGGPQSDFVAVPVDLPALAP